MASVRLSRDLRSTIHRNAMQAFDVSTPEPQFPTHDVNFIIDKVTSSEAQKKLAAIASMFLDLPTYKSEWSYSSADRKYAFGFDAPYQISATELIIIKHKANDSRAARCSVSLPRSVQLFAVRKNAEVTLDVFTDPADKAKVLEIVNRFEQRQDEYSTNRREYYNTVNRLLDKCSTLKQFLTAWPAGEAFIPQDKINELHTKVTRIQKARQIKEDIHFDDTAVNKVVLTAKLMGN